MSYAYRNTYRMDENTFVEDRGYAHAVKRGEPDFTMLEAEFADVPVGSTAVRGTNGEGWVVEEGCGFMEARKSAQLAIIDAEISAAIVGGFGYFVDGENLHFSYDTFDQQNFADSANVAILAQSGVEGLPASVTWNAYRNRTASNGGELVRLTLNPASFLALYTAGALAHKATQMEIGGQRKADVMAGVVGSEDGVA